MNAIETRKLTKIYGKNTAVDALDLTIGQGELFSLLGTNGAGKTTTIKMLSCLVRPTHGDAYMLGVSILNNAYQVKEKISISPQETAVAHNLTVAENLEFIARIYAGNKQLAAQKSHELAAALKLTDVAGQKAKTLSGGMQRRLSIAMALITDPQILFLDEPTLGLDVLARRELWAIIRNLKGKMTIILTTHYMEEAEALSDRIGIMAKGKLTAMGTVTELITQTDAGSFEDAFITLATGSEVVG